MPGNGKQDAHEHDAWFRDKVEQGLREADDLAVRRIPHDEVWSNWRRQRAELVRRSGREPA